MIWCRPNEKLPKNSIDLKTFGLIICLNKTLDNMRSIIAPILFSIAIIIAAIVLGNAVINRNDKDGIISVTGSGQADFTSDLIVWEARFSKDNPELKQAYALLEKDRKLIEEYLQNKGIKDEDLIFTSIEIMENSRPIYSSNGSYMGTEFLGYTLNQSFKIESKEVEKIEKLSREITELLNEGVQLYSEPPRYYYTQLADLKIDMISEATQDARSRAKTITEHSGSNLDRLITADLGVFQITGQNSNEDYTWGGVFNTSDKKKTASVTVRLEYQIE